MMRATLLLVGLIVISQVAPAGEKTPPAGWREVTAKDKSFTVWLPMKAGRTSERERTSTIQGIKLKFEVVQLDANNGPVFNAASVQFPINFIKQLTQKERIELFRDIFVADLMGRVDGEADIKQGKIPGKEFFVTTPNGGARLVVFASGSRVWQAMIAGSKAQVESAEANTFLDSFKLPTAPPKEVATAPKTTEPKTTEPKKTVTPPPVTSPPKTTTNPKPAAGGAIAEWTTDIASMVFPEGPASGKIMGGDFKVEQAKLEPTSGRLTLRMGKGIFPDAEIAIDLTDQGKGSVAGKTFEIASDAPPGKGRFSIFLKRMQAGEKVPKSTIVPRNYALKLEFDNAQNGIISGRIYVCMNDANRSFVAGTFQLRK